MIADDYFKYYIDLVKQNHYLDSLRDNYEHTIKILSDMDEEKGNHAYADGKWTIKQVIMHNIDCERVWHYRAFTIAREDNPSLPGFDHDAYAFKEVHNSKSLDQIVEEYKASKAAFISLFEGFSPEELAAIGKANGKPIQVEAIGWIAAGHEIHHMQVLKDKYL